MSTENSKSDEVNESLDSMFNMDLGGDDLLGHPINFDLLDKEDGAEVGGNQSDTHLATEEGNREQSHSVTDSGPPQDRMASECMGQQGCQQVAELANLLQRTLSRIDTLEAEKEDLKSTVQTLSSRVDALGAALMTGSEAAKAQADLCAKRRTEGVKFTSKLTETQRLNWISYYDCDLKPPLSSREALEFIDACGWPADRLQQAGTATVNDVACGIARLYYCQNMSDGIDKRHHYICWNRVTKTECLDFIVWAAPCLGEWLESLQSNEREAIFNSYRAGHLNIELANQPGATAQEVFIKAGKRKKTKLPPQAPKKVSLEGDIRRGDNVSIPMEQGHDRQPQIGSLQPRDNEPAPKVPKPSEAVLGPSEAEKLLASRRRVTKTWRTAQVKRGHFYPNHVQLLVTSLKETLRIQGIPPHSNDEEDCKLQAYQVITSCKEQREEEAYQAKVAETSTPPAAQAHPTRVSSTPAAANVLLPPNHTYPEGTSEGNFISRDIRERQQQNNIRGGGAPLQTRGRGLRGSQRGNHHGRGKPHRGGPYKPRPRGH